MEFNSTPEFLDYFQKELKANRIVLPTLPDVALKVRDSIIKNEANAYKLAEIILTDTALSARLIQVANSPLFRGTHEIINIQMAVTRLGNKTVHSLVSSLVMQQIFSPTTDILEQYFRQIWTQSINVAAISRALCSFTRHLNSDEAMLAGLIHQIGKLPILTIVENMPDIRENRPKLDALLDDAHQQIGAIIMDTWNFPEELKKVPSEYLNFQRNSGPTADYVDIVQVAYLQTVAGSNHPSASVNLNAVPAFSKLNLAPDIEILEIEGIKEEVET
ncbi:MAG: HDOD domain-containing protein, partial [Gammaproteobacteria bacterium]